MNNIGDLWFWIVAIGAAILKIALSPWAGYLAVLISFGAGLFSAFVFADPVMAYFNLDQNIYRNLAIAVVVMTGEGVVRWLIYVSSKPSRIIDLIKLWRNGGGK